MVQRVKIIFANQIIINLKIEEDLYDSQEKEMNYAQKLH
jgi:hypothetical protein